MAFRDVITTTGRSATDRNEVKIARRDRHQLSIMQAGWLAAAALTIPLVVVSIPVIYDQTRSICAGDPCITGQLGVEGHQVLHNIGISTDAYAVYWTTLVVVSALVWTAIGGVIFWRRSNEWIALLVSLMLVLAGAIGPSSALAASQTIWRHPALLLNSLAFLTLIIVFYVFPDGTFVPRWTRWLALVIVAFEIGHAYFPQSPLNPDWWSYHLGTVVFLGTLASPVVAQIYRYRRVSSTVQRQQTKWVVAGMTATMLAITVYIGVGDFDVDQRCFVLP